MGLLPKALTDVANRLKNEAEKRLREAGQLNPTAQFDQARGAIGKPDMVIQVQNGKKGPGEYFRVDENKSGMYATKLTGSALTPELKAQAKPQAQLQAELNQANTPQALTTAIERAQKADELVGQAAKGAKYVRDTSLDDNLARVSQSGSASDTRQEIIADMERSLNTLGKIKDDKMNPAQKESIGNAIRTDIEHLDHIETISGGLKSVQAAMQAPADPLAGPAVNRAPAPDPLAAHP